MANAIDIEAAELLRAEWVARLAALVAEVEGWAKADGWETRRLDKEMRDSEIGTYQAPALIFQKEFARLLLDPIGRDGPGADGVVDLYKMPAFDDIATIYFAGGEWHLHHVPPRRKLAAPVDEPEPVRLNREAFVAAVGGMVDNGE